MAAFVYGINALPAAATAGTGLKVQKRAASAVPAATSSRARICCSVDREDSEASKHALVQAREEPSVQQDLAHAQEFDQTMVTAAALALALVMVGAPDAANAADGLTELMKTKPASLVHPITMWILFGTCAYTGYLGWQVRELKTTDDAEKKKELAKEKPGQKHFAMSSSLMAVVTLVTFEGMANTFSRAGKLFPGPHLYAGLGLVATMTFMASLVPAMQKSSKPARDAHLAAGVFVIGLFAWQAKTGMDIVGKLLGWA
ncbi:hypothetical protein FVE85_5357 [Porphyridium purpureum]|uniref:Uncharacterized protein n=1 Tax=Porphyridium purpureum TaxID=35688 RepID=A0A5J4Z3H9_PORPP|nr:hypothetical protein FVE85_5357 [Porphyridium purpureum]|eukprot:POR3959..scf295_1